ncbi:MAG: PHP domain-containing protein [Acidobacteria bacterium]|nr:PHP domain-containing protein [Acidobacteriota bacterium]
MIDLHLHTTASDGRLTPAALVDRAVAAGLTTMAVTDHDTTASIDEVTQLADTHGIRVVPGIEITAVDEGRDVHMLAYFIEHHDAGLQAFLGAQRELRITRVREVAARLAAHGVAVDVEALLAKARAKPGTAIGRPWLARALVRAGHAVSVADAFDRWLGQGQPAFVPRIGPSPFDVLGTVHRVGGIVSFAHPYVTKKDALLAPLAAAGLDAIEVYHSDHPADVRERYHVMADTLGVAVSGGSDFHGTGETRATLGAVWLPPHEFAALEARRASISTTPSA